MKKIAIALFPALLWGVFAGCQSTENILPEPGEYLSFTVTGNMNYNNKYNSNQKTWEWKWESGVEFMPSPFGRLKLNANATYEFIDLKQSGTVKYDAQSKKLKFTGFMHKAEGIYKVQNGVCMILISTVDNNGTVNTLQFEKKSTLPKSTALKPNSVFTGKIIASFEGNATGYVDLESAKKIYTFLSGAGGVTTSGRLHVHIYKDNPYDFKEIYPNVIITDSKGQILKRFKGASSAGKTWAIGDYWYGSPSPDGTKIILTGKYVAGSNPFSSNYVAPYPMITVIDLNGNELKQFETDSQFGWGASWLPDGGLIFAAKGGGINITDNTLSLVKKIYYQSVYEARCSPDGKQVVFAKGANLYLIDINGQNERLITTTDNDLSFQNVRFADVCWSPDSKSIAACFKNGAMENYFAVLAAVNGSSFSYLNDVYGEKMYLAGPFIAWVK
jgi:hypothetical protein